MTTTDRAPSIRMERRGDTVTLILQGDLRSLFLAPIEAFLDKELPRNLPGCRQIIWDMQDVSSFDTASALLLLQYENLALGSGTATRIDALRPEFEELLVMVSERTAKIAPWREEKRLTWLERFGRRYIKRYSVLVDLLLFFGTVTMIFMTYFREIRNIRIKEILFEINESAVKALGIVGLTTFLIGVVIAYQASVQLQLYGANMFIVDMLGISIFRELSPLITAIVVAGRSGSAYAAQIGVMKITEELDAMRTMGFDPYAFLVLPRIIALMLMMPILIFFADIMGVLGGMLVANVELGLTPAFFLDRFVNVIDIRHFWIGLFKGPMFALLIALIGIYRGLRVRKDTQSIGFNTTKSVVESIFAVIICDAVFSIVFTNLEM